jgi:hypothetical protein
MNIMLIMEVKNFLISIQWLIIIIKHSVLHIALFIPGLLLKLCWGGIIRRISYSVDMQRVIVPFFIFMGDKGDFFSSYFHVKYRQRMQLSPPYLTFFISHCSFSPYRLWMHKNFPVSSLSEVAFVCRKNNCVKKKLCNISNCF